MIPTVRIADSSSNPDDWYEVGDEIMPPILDVLQAIDASFRPIPHIAVPTATTKFRSQAGFDVEFLTPNRGSDDH